MNVASVDEKEILLRGLELSRIAQNRIARDIANQVKQQDLSLFNAPAELEKRATRDARENALMLIGYLMGFDGLDNFKVTLGTQGNEIEPICLVFVKGAENVEPVYNATERSGAPN